jgi:hypothetical protein
MNIKQAKTIPIEVVLRAIGAQETKAKADRSDVWFKSPLREGDNDASFIAHPHRGTWHDFGSGEGGDVIALAQAHLNGASVSEALRWLDRFAGDSIESPRDASRTRTSAPLSRPAKVSTPAAPRYELTREKSLGYAPLLAYCNDRGISQATARRYCSEIQFQPVEKKRPRPLFGIGFATDDPDTWEVRGIAGNFKAVIGHKTTSTIYGNDKQDPDTLHVFEGFFDFLTFAETSELQPNEAALVLNSASLAERGLQLVATASRLQNLVRVFTWFDNDDTGRAITQRYADELGPRYQVGDMSPHYSEHQDLNAGHVANKSTGRGPSWKSQPATHTTAPLHNVRFNP